MGLLVLSPLESSFWGHQALCKTSDSLELPYCEETQGSTWKKERERNPLAAQWSGLHVSTAKGPGPTPGQGTRILQPVQCSQRKEGRKGGRGEKEREGKREEEKGGEGKEIYPCLALFYPSQSTQHTGEGRRPPGRSIPAKVLKRQTKEVNPTSNSHQCPSLAIPPNSSHRRPQSSWNADQQPSSALAELLTCKAMSRTKGSLFRVPKC